MTRAVARRIRRVHNRLRPNRKRRKVWVVVRISDGKYWAGEYRWQGRTFTAHKHFAHLWGTPNGAEAAVKWRGWTHVRVAKVNLMEFARRPRQRRI